MKAKNQNPEFAKKLVAGLRKQWPNPRCEVNHSNPLELMVGVILSAQSTDKRVNEVTKTLFKKYRKPEDYLKVSPDIFEKEIHSCGFFRSKSKSIRGACRMIVEKFGGKVPKTMEELLELPGIGRKSANVILGAGYGITSGIVVDTHMIRLTSQRLLLTPFEDPIKIEQDMQEIVPKKDWVFFSQSMVLHGRYICIARAPRCYDCMLINICPFPDKILSKPDKKDEAPLITITGVPVLTRR